MERGLLPSTRGLESVEFTFTLLDGIPNNSMNPISKLTKSALLGVDRFPSDPRDLSGSAGDLLAQVPDERPARNLLLTAGVYALQTLAGHKTLESSDTLKAAPTETLRHSPAFLATLFQEVFTLGQPRLQYELLRKMAELTLCVPDRCLPLALDSGKRNTSLRKFLYPLLGGRGQWLASLNPEWKYALSANVEEDTLRMWHEGNLEQRKSFLMNLRSNDPSAARELVKNSLTSEGAKERAVFLDCLSVGLNLADEALLEKSLSDKSKEVRSVSAKLLASLEHSAFGDRMIARLESCLSAKGLKASIRLGKAI
jgi:hypothetical protein